MPQQHLDGISLAPLLGGEANLNRNNLYWHFPHYHSMPPHGAVRSGNWKLVVRYETEQLELFDLLRDPGKKSDLSRAKPEVAVKLREYLRKHLDAVGGQMPTPNPNYKAGKEGEGVGEAAFDQREGDPVRGNRPVSANPENGANWPV